MTDAVEMIKREIKQRRLPLAELAKRLELHPTTVHGMLDRKTMQVQKLLDLCGVFKYNFFKEIAEQLPYEKPSYENAFNEEINRLKEENKILNIKLDVLNGVIEKIG